MYSPCIELLVYLEVAQNKFEQELSSSSSGSGRLAPGVCTPYTTVPESNYTKGREKAFLGRLTFPMEE